MKEVQRQSLLYQESIRDEAELRDTTGVDLLQGRTAGKTRAMVAIKVWVLDTTSISGFLVR